MFPGIKFFYFEMRKEMYIFQDLPIISSSVYTGICYYQSCLQVVNQLMQKYGEDLFL